MKVIAAVLALCAVASATAVYPVQTPVVYSTDVAKSPVVYTPEVAKTVYKQPGVVDSYVQKLGGNYVYSTRQFGSDLYKPYVVPQYQYPVQYSGYQAYQNPVYTSQYAPVYGYPNVHQPLVY